MGIITIKPENYLLHIACTCCTTKRSATSFFPQVPEHTAANTKSRSSAACSRFAWCAIWIHPPPPLPILDGARPATLRLPHWTAISSMTHSWVHFHRMEDSPDFGKRGTAISPQPHYDLWFTRQTILVFEIGRHLRKGSIYSRETHKRSKFNCSMQN